MDFLKSTLTSALSKGPAFGYAFNDRVSLPGDDNSTVFSLFNATKRDDGTPCSVFSFEVNDATRSRLPLAKNALRKLRTLRHPGVVKVLDSVETETYIYIATERVTPLKWHVRRDSLVPETIKWGLWSVAITLKFLNEEAKSIHGNIRLGSIFTSESGEWKLAGFEVLSSVQDDEPFIYRYGGLMPDSGRYATPEVVKEGWEVLKKMPVHVTDSWGYGTLIYEAFNGVFNGGDQLPQPKKVPATIQTAYKRLIAANPKTRLSVAHFLEQGLRQRSFFDTPLIHISEFVENMGIKDAAEREVFLDELERTGDEFPEAFFKMKILPELLKSVEFGGGGPKVFGGVLKIGEKLSDEEWESSITPVVVRLFSLPDRATRVFLLDNLSRMIDHLSNKVVNDKIFPDMLTGFSDTAPIVREQTVKAVLTIINKLSDRHINGDLLKHLAKTQNDEQPGIRTNTTICLGKIAHNLGANTRQKVLIAAFTRSLRDPFLHARNAALLALSATSEVFDETDCATKVLPAIAPSLVDKEKMIRTQATKTMEIYLSRIKTLTASYPDTILPPEGSEQSMPGAMPGMGPKTSTTAAAAGAGQGVLQSGGWTSWAVGTLTAAAGQMATRAAAAAEERPSSAPLAKPEPTRPTIKSAATTTPKTTSSTVDMGNVQPGGFLDDDDDDVDGWGAMDDDIPVADEEPEEQEEEPHSFFDALEKKVGRTVPAASGKSAAEVTVNKPLSATGKPPLTTASGFGFGATAAGQQKKPFVVNNDDFDFDSLVGKTVKKELPRGLAKKTAGKGMVLGGKKPGAKSAVVKKGGEEEDDWESAWA